MKILLISLLCWLSVRSSDGSCYSDWSRCSKWSSGATGILWKSCHDRCVELGNDTGECKPVRNSCWWMPAHWKVLRCCCRNNTKSGGGTCLTSDGDDKTDCCKKVQVQENGGNTVDYYLADTKADCPDGCGYTQSDSYGLMYCFVDKPGGELASCPEK